MKRFLSLLLALVMVLTLCACGEDSPAVTEPSQTLSPTDAPTDPSVAPTEPPIDPTEPPVCSHIFTDANCTQAPVCTICGYSSGSALGHVYTDGVCIHCGAEDPNAIPSACEHSYQLREQTAPSCTDTGSKIFSCSLCGHSYTESLPATGHSWIEATCETYKECRICGETAGDALGHAYQNGICSRCGAADPDFPKEITYTVTVRSDKGTPFEGVIVSVTAGSSTATGTTNKKGIATMQLLPADSYVVTLDRIPPGSACKESYTFTSTTVNINLSTLSVITPTDHSKANYKVGSTIGDFTLTDTDNNTYELEALLAEKDMVILNFWFTNCYWCLQEFPHFEEISQKYDNIQLLAIDPFDSKASISQFKDQSGYTFPMISETIGLAEGFGITAYPTTVFIDSNGKVLSIITGAFPSMDALESHILTLLK